MNLRRLLMVALVVAAIAPAAAAAADPYTVQTLHFDTVVGPNDDQHCDVVGDLYKPNGADAAHPAPAILTTNGFGGSKDDQATEAKAFATRGYVVLSYSGLGFGGSGCKITLDDRDYDGKAGSQLITYLGKLDYVRHDGPGDPRVGMIGGSYGGEIQFAVAGIDPRLDTIIPQITWNDLSYSLAPNNWNFDHGVSSDTPGVEKFEWTSLFFALGIADGVTGAQSDPTRLVGQCPNFDDRACSGKVHMDALGYPGADTVSFARHASVESFIDDIHIPTFLSQGQSDTLFNLQESAATYRALKARGVPVKLMWQQWGHSGGAAPGEIDAANPEQAYDSSQYLAWFDHYLKGTGPKPALDVSWFRDWISYDTKGSAAPAYDHAPALPVGPTSTLYLSGSGDLTGDRAKVAAGSQNFVTPPQAPASYTETSALDQSQDVRDTPGTFASFTSAPLTSDTDVVGSPSVDVRLSAPANANPVDPAQDLVLFFKLYDVAPDGTIVLAHRLIAPARFSDPNRTVHVELPGIVHRFAKGHRLELVIAGSDAAYRGDAGAWPVTVSTDAAKPGVLRIPLAPVPTARKKATRKHRAHTRARHHRARHH
jgi:ABC-2 type transport system ATP-binding protein